MAQKRTKSNTQIEPIANWEEADKTIKRIGDLLLKITSHKTNAKDLIDNVKTALAENIKPLQDEIGVLTGSLEAFAANNIKDFGKAQSKKLNFGLLGWRKSTAISIKQTTLNLIKIIFRKTAEKYIRVEESVIKEALKDLTELELASVDARRTNKEPFFVEPDIPKAIDYGT